MSLESRLQAIRESSRLLSEHSDELTDKVLSVEADLHRIQPSVEVWVPDALNGPGGRWSLGFSRLRGTWRIVVASPKSPDPIALVAAPRAVRVKAAPCLEALLDRLLEAMQKRIAELVQEVDRAKEQL